MHPEDEWINITEASRRYRRSRPTITRLIKREGIETCRRGRSRLVNVADLEAVMPVISILEDRGVIGLIDDVLRVLYSYHHRLASSLAPGMQRPLNIEELRKGMIHHHLIAIAGHAFGERNEPKKELLERIDFVLQLLFRPPMTENYSIPRPFWETMLGQIISLAEFRSYDPAELISTGQAALRVKVDRSTIYRWMDEGHFRYVNDPRLGRTFVVLEDVEALVEESRLADGDGDQQDRGPPDR